jgi:hypothetical protein
LWLDRKELWHIGAYVIFHLEFQDNYYIYFQIVKQLTNLINIDIIFFKIWIESIHDNYNDGSHMVCEIFTAADGAEVSATGCHGM